MPFVVCAPNKSSSLCKRIFLLPVLLAGLLLPAPAGAQESQSEPSPAQARQEQPIQLHERRQTLVEPEPAKPARPFHGVRYRVNPKLKNTGGYAADCSSPSLAYYGGPVISNVQIVVVYWNSDVNATIQADIPNFYKGLTDSTWFDMLSEYSTNVASSGGGTPTDQSIGRGSYAAAYTIVPSLCKASSSSCTLTDADIQTELQTQITNGVLPQPTNDLNGYNNTLYATFFPPLVHVRGPDGAGNSCANGGFCAYHNTGGTTADPLTYAVLMDEFTSECNTGCGNGTDIENQESTASHEMAESVTDEEIGLLPESAPSIAYPVAWYDPNNECGEVADICDSGDVYGVTTPQGTEYVQPLWSNANGECLIVGSHPLYAFSSPAPATAGVPFNFTVTAQNPAGGKGTDTSYVGTMHFTSSDTSATLPADFTYTSADQGTESFSATLVTGTSQSITATDTVNSAITASSTYSISPSVATHFSVTGPNPAPFNTAFSITITALNAANNVVTTYNGTVALTSSDPGFVNNGPVTLTSGTTNVNAVLKTAAVQSITATDVSNATLTGTGYFTVNPGPANMFAVSAPTSATAGSSFNFTVAAQDLYGNTATSYSGTVHFSSTDTGTGVVLPANSTLTNGVGTFSATLFTAGNQTITATDTVTASITGTSQNILVNIANLVVNQTGDDAGSASNCVVQPTPGTTTNADTCSLRDALLEAAALGSGSITFDSTVFSAANTASNPINLTNGTLNIPADTSIVGPTGSGYTPGNQVTVAGGGSSNQFSVFTVNSGVTAASISGLTITGGYAGYGGAIYSSGALTLSNSTLSGNTANEQGGGIYSASGALTVLDSTFSTNSTLAAGGAAIYEISGTLNVSSSTFSSNNSHANGGAVIFNGNTGTVANSTFSGNTAANWGGAIFPGSGTLTVSNSIFTGNSARSGAGIYSEATTNASYNLFYNNVDADAGEDDCNGCTSNNNAVTTNPDLSPLGSYGGPTQTMVPTPGSGAICAASSSLIPAGITVDQRGLPDSTTYGSTTCYDIGAVQSNYALSFTTSPSATQYTYVALMPAPVVALTESGVAATFVSSGTVTLSDTTTTLAGHPSIALSSGSASFPSVGISATASSDALTATLPLNAAIPVSVTSSPSSSFAVDAQVAATWSGPANNSMLPGPTATFSWTGGVGIQYYELLVGTNGVGTSNIYNSGLLTGSSAVVTIPTTQPELYVSFRQLIGGAWHAWQQFTYNISAIATLTAPAQGTTLTGSTANFTWSGGVGVVYYELLVGTTGQGSSNVYNPGLISPATQSETVTLPANEPILYASFRQLSGGVWQPWQYYTYNASAIATLTAPTQGATLSGTTANFTWSGGAGVVDYELLVGTNGQGSSNVYNPGLISPATQSETVTLPAGEPMLYVSFRQLSGGVWQPWQYSTYNEPAIATLTAPVQGATLTGTTANFTWSGGVGVVYYELLAGTKGQGSTNVYNPGLISPATQSETITLPASGSTLYVSFRQLSGGAWQPWQYSTYSVQ